MSVSVLPIKILFDSLFFRPRIDIPNDHDWDSITPVQAHRDNRRGCLPSTKIDGIGSPIGHPRPKRPSLVLGWHGVHISIRPYFGGGQRGVLLGKLPGLDGGTSRPDSRLGRKVLRHRGELGIETRSRRKGCEPQRLLWKKGSHGRESRCYLYLACIRVEFAELQ